MAWNIGLTRVKVVLRDKSPFAAQPRQEQAYYFTRDVVGGMSPNRIHALPSPINGIRVDELDGPAFDNYLYDGDKYLEESSTYDDSSSSSSPSTGSPSDDDIVIGPRRTSVSPDVAARAAEVVSKRQQLAANPNNPANKAGLAELQFFTWKPVRSLFKELPTPPKFGVAATADVPEWDYVALPMKTNEKRSLRLMPFMVKNPPDNKHSIHWGAQMITSLALNQPIEMTFCIGSAAAVPDEYPDMTPLFDFFDENGKPMDLQLQSNVYLFAILGTTNPQHCYGFLFKRESNPYFFKIQGKRAQLLTRFPEFQSNSIFDNNNQYFTLHIEPVLGSFIVRSNQFANTPWIIQAPTTDPIFIGDGPVTLLGGNVQAGFSLRPVQYFQNGKCATPETTFTIVQGGGLPSCCATAKGAGENQQAMTNEISSAASSGFGAGFPSVNSKAKVYMADTERFEGCGAAAAAPGAGAAGAAKGLAGGGGGRVKTYLEAESGQDGRGGRIDRLIRLSTKRVVDPNGNPTPIERKYKVEIELTASDVMQGNGYIVKNGRSAYLWMVRCELGAQPGADPQDETDISCDVMSIDLSWNATSYNEMNQSGTLRVLNRPSGLMDYRSITNRATYLRIEAWFELGVGYDPARVGKSRQIFEGMIVGATVETKAENEIVVFKIEDYMNALQGGKFVLSPYYDGMKSSLAVRDIVQQLGLPDPKILTGDTQIIKANLANDFGLPLSNPLEEPKFRFPDGSSYKDGILKIARLDFKTIYFDNLGRFHYDVMPGGIFGDGAVNVVEQFWSSPIEGNNWGEDLRRQTWNMISFTRLINDVYNVIQVTGVEKRLLARITGASAYKAGIFNPKAEGYLGYRKHLFIAIPALGSVDAVFRYLDNYRRRVFIPPLTARFEIYGWSGLKPLDIIEVDGQKLRIMNISTRINAAENMYWMNIEGEWFFSAGKGMDPNLLPEGAGAGNNGAANTSTGSPGESSGYTGG